MKPASDRVRLLDRSSDAEIDLVGERMRLTLIEVLGRKPAPEDRSSRPMPPRPEGRRRLRVLVAEDNAVNQKVVMGFLDRAGHAAVVVSTGAEALAALERHDFDVVLMDVQMPELDGIEATRRIRRQERSSGGHVPIVALTAHVVKGDAERCLEGELLERARALHDANYPDGSELVPYIVRRGDTLGRIASRYGSYSRTTRVQERPSWPACSSRS